MDKDTTLNFNIFRNKAAGVKLQESSVSFPFNSCFFVGKLKSKRYG